MKKLIVISFVVFQLFSGCFPEEKTINALPQFVQRLDLVRENNGQIYYSLRDRKVVASNGIYDWDLGFSCEEGAFSIIVNSAKRMGVFNTHSKDFEAEYNADFLNYAWQYDHPSGDVQKTCIGAWGDFSFKNPQSFGEVYIINRGYDIYNIPYQLKKLRIDGFRNDSFEITYADVNGDFVNHVFIPKNDSFNFVFLNLDHPEEVLKLEPEKAHWDILISTYIDSLRYHNIYSKPDSVNGIYGLYDGILMNSYNQSVALDTINDFNKIDFFDVGGYTYKMGKNVIGNQWYYWDKKMWTYAISYKHIFIIKSGELNYYVLDLVEINKENRNKLSVRFAIKNL